MGSIVKGIGKAVKKVFKGIAKFVKKYWKAIVIAVAVVAAVVFTAGLAAPAVAGVAAPAAAAAPAAIAAPTTAAAGSAIAGSSTVGTVLSGGTAGSAAAQGLIAGAGAGAGEGAALTAGLSAGATSTVAADTAAPLFMQSATNTTADALISAKATAESLTGVSAATPASQTTTQAIVSNAQAPLSEAAQANLYANADGLGLEGLKEYVAANPVGTAAIKDASGNVLVNTGKQVIQGVKGASKTAMKFASDHPYLTGIGLQAAGGALTAYAKAKAEGEKKKDFGGLATKEGKVWNGNGLIDYKNSQIASQEFKQRAGVAPIEVTATPTATLPTPSGLINPPKPATISVANAEQINKGLIGNVKITGT